MKRIVLTLALLAAFAAPAAAKNLRYEVSGFTEIDVSRGVQVEVEQGPTFSVRSEGPDADNVAVRVSGDTLRVYRRGWGLFGSGGSLDVTVRVTLPRITGLSAAQGATLNARNVSAGALRIGATQGGSLSVEGVCTRLDASASMGGSVNAGALRCETVEAGASMGGHVRVHANESAEARASMGGQIDVGGEPARTNFGSTMGGGISSN